MKWMMNFIFGIQINIEVFCKLILSFWLCITRHAQSSQNKFRYLSSISRKAWGMKLIFLPTDKHKNVLQIDSTTLVVHSRACSKCLKQQVYNIFALSQGKHKGWSWFLPVDICRRFLQSDTIILKVCSQACSNYPK